MRQAETPTESFPLKWPAHWKRTQYPSESRFGQNGKKPTIAAGAAFLRDELQRMRCSNIVISSNLEIRRDGLPYTKQVALDKDRGIAAYFTRKGKQLVIACDQYNAPGCNLHALAKTIEALRGIERWGCSELLNQAFDGFQALPPVGGTTNNEVWFDVLGVDENAPAEVVEAAYKALLKRVHPDIPVTGDAQKFTAVQAAWTRFKQLTR